MQLDECVKLPCSHEEAERAMRLSLRWAERSKSAFGQQAAGRYLASSRAGRRRIFALFSASALVEMGFDGYAIGGLAVGEPQEAMLDLIETVPHLPFDKPRYLMGVGTPDDLLQALRRGVDMFDCVLPTRAGRHGHGLHAPRSPQPAQRALRGGSAPDRSAVVVADGEGLLARLLATSGEVRRDLAMMGLTEINLAYYHDLMSGARKPRGRAARLLYTKVQRDWAEGETDDACL